jgi:hypothetical protein
MIRDRAKDVAKALRIPDDKFKASAGWIENFKNRHGIRKGIWAARASGIPVDEPAMPPLDSAFNSGPEAIGEQQRLEGRLPFVEGELPEPLRRDSSQLPPLRPTWQSETSTDSVSLSRSVNRHEPVGVIRSSMPQQANTERHHRHLSDAAMHVDHIPDLQTDPTYGSPIPGHHSTVYTTPLDVYPPLPPLTSATPPSFAEAEDAINKVIMFIDSHDLGTIITVKDRTHLNDIKYALFQAGSGVPYDRGAGA